MRHKVDPAALLIAVFAVGAGPLLQSGSWTYLNSLIAAVVLLVILAFSWPDRPTLIEQPLTRVTTLAYAAVYGFVIAIGVAWPAQRLWAPTLHLTKCVDPSKVTDFLSWQQSWDCINSNSNTLGNAGTIGGLLVGALAAMIFGLLLWRQQRRANASRVVDLTGQQPDVPSRAFLVKPEANILTSGDDSPPQL